MRVLIVEDDPVLANGLNVGLRLGGFGTEVVHTIADARVALSAGGFEGVVLDIGLPDGSGVDLVAELRRAGNSLPILLLTARDQVADRVEGLDRGADDYMGKPFDMDELGARLRALLRRGEGRATPDLVWNGLTLDPAQMTGRMEGRKLRFSTREFTILHHLMERPGTIRSKGELEERLYGWTGEVESNTVEVHVHNLRSKLGSQFIETVRGVGYRVALTQR